MAGTTKRQKMKKIAVVEDETDLRELLKLHLERESYIPLLFPDGDQFLEFAEKNSVDMLLLDIMLPGTDGMDVCRILRADERTKDLPIIMVTAKSTESYIVVGLELGADDYITKPFSIAELMARIKALFRRMSKSESQTVLKTENVELYPDKFQLNIEGKPVELTTTEFKILEALMRKQGRVFTRSQILDVLGEDRQFIIDRTVDVHILNIRRKLGKYGKIIQTIRGIGYKIIED